MQINNQLSVRHKPLYVQNFKANNSSHHPTEFVRSGVEWWNNITDFIIKKNEKTRKVNVYTFGASAGDEVFTLLMSLYNKLGVKKAQKFLKLMASDIDPNIMENPKNGIMKFTPADLQRINELVGDYSRFFKLIGTEYVLT